MRMFKHCLAAMLLAASAQQAMAQAYPSKPIHVIIGEAAGGGGDIFSRLVGGEITKQTGQPIVVESKLGANSTIAARAVVTAAPDGYTLFFGPVQLIHPLFTKNNSIVASREMTAISTFMSGAWQMFVSGKVPANSLKELVAYSKANPNKLNFGAPSTVNEVLMKLLQSKTGLTYTTIPYNSTPLVVNAILGGQIDFTISSAPPFLPHLKTGAAKAIMVTTAKRFEPLPDIPSSTDAGVPGYNAGFYYSFWGPAGLPRDIVQRLSGMVIAAAKNPEIAARVRQASFVPEGTTPEETLKLFEADIAFWKEATAIAGYQPQ